MAIYCKCDGTSELLQQPELASVLELDLRDFVDWGKKGLVNFNPFVPNAPFLYPLETEKPQGFLMF